MLIKNNHKSGFTLIELMIAVAIVGILAAFAIPSYTQYVARSKLSEATSNLLQMASLQEQFYRDFRQYAGSYAAGGAAPAAVGTGIITWNYSVSAVADPNANPGENFTYTVDIDPAAQSFAIQAIGKGNLSSYSYAINSNNVKCKRTDNMALDFTYVTAACPAGSTVW